MDESKREQNKSKRSKSEHIRNVVSTYLQKRNYSSTTNVGSFEKITSEQQLTYSCVETAISKPNSILYSCYNSDPLVIDHNFTKFITWVKDLMKNRNICQDLEYLIGPLFIHLYLDILKGGHVEKAAVFFKSHLPTIDRTKCDDFVKEIINVLASECDATLMKEEYRTNKYFIQLTSESIKELKNFVADNCHVVFLHILQNWFNIEEIYDNHQVDDAIKMPQSDRHDDGDKFKKINEIINELKQKNRQVFIANLTNTKEAITCGIIRRSCGLIIYNQINFVKLRSIHQFDSILGHNCAEIQFVHHSQPIYGIALSRNNTILTTCSGDNTVAIYDLNTMELIHQCQGHLGAVYCVAISSNRMYIGSGSQDTTARLWSTNDGANLRIFAGHTQAVTCLDFHPNCLYLATGSADRNLRLWSIDNGSPLRLFHGSKGVIYSLSFSPDGESLASGGDDKKLRIWDILSSKSTREIRYKGDPITRLAWGRQSQQICGGSSDGTVKIWDLNPGTQTTDGKFEPIFNFTANGQLYDIEFSFGTFACLTSKAVK